MPPEIIGIDEAYEDLANAIVVRAIDDYKEVLMGISNKNSRKYCSKEKLMRFFTSTWFEELCAIDSESFLDQIGRLMEVYKFAYDVVKEHGGTRYYVVTVEDSMTVDGPFRSKSKALHRAAELQGIDYTEYSKLRRSYYRDKDQ